MLGKGNGGLSKAPTLKERSERLIGEGDKIEINFIDLRFERGHAVGFRKGIRRQDVLKTACSWDEG